MRVRGFTIAEALVVLVIIAIMSYLLYPLFMKVKRQVQIRSSIGKLRQIHLAVENYRQAWDGADVFTSYRSYHRIGLPPGGSLPWRQLTDTTWRDWLSGCANSPNYWENDFVIRDTASLPFAPAGYISLVVGYYSPRAIEISPGNWADYHDYIPRYRQNIVIAADPYCNPPGTNMMAQFVYKRGLALLLSGQVVNKYDMGNAFYLHWWSDPPED